MREILFRGKPKNKEHSYFFSEIWKEHCKDGFVYGYLIVDKDRCFIAVSVRCSVNHCVNNGIVSIIEVIPETVGQYTGLTDKNGNKIFEEDIIKIHLNNGKCVYAEVYFKNGVFTNSLSTYLGEMIEVTSKSEVVSNIYDNPEILKNSHEIE